MKFIVFLITFIGISISHTTFANILSKGDVLLYKQIFSAHQKGEYKKAASLEKKISNNLLNGYILHDKFFSPRYRTKSSDVNSFLKKYNHLPIASDVYALGKKKKFKISAPIPKDIVYGSGSNACSFVKRVEPINLILKQKFSYLTPKKQKRAKQLSNRLKSLIERKRLTQALNLLHTKEVQSLFNKKDRDIVYTAVAFSFFLIGNDDKALLYANKAISGSGNELPLAYWTAGLSSWRKNEYADAAEYFEETALHDKGYPLLKGSASFWAARAHLKEGNFQKVGDFLELAAEQPRTFYGLMALHMMGSTIENILDEHSITQHIEKESFSHPALNRFYALKEIGKDTLADKELAALFLKLDDEKKNSLITLAKEKGFHKNLTALAGVSLDTKERFPMPNWEPLNKWKIKKELVFAFVRQESCFNKRAKSSVGARGLMQIMPQTGKVIAKMSGLKFNLSKMENESYNLTLGQNYLQYLMNLPAIDSNLIYTAVAYNAGPGNLIKWKNEMKYQNDPLLFIESIPSRETRGFVERIMVNYWIYNSITNTSLKSLDDIVHGKWPIYENAI